MVTENTRKYIAFFNRNGVYEVVRVDPGLCGSQSDWLTPDDVGSCDVARDDIFGAPIQEVHRRY
jgi:hypothetical protein